MHLHESTVYSNSAANGGGVAARVSAYGSTFHTNTADVRGGGLRLYGEEPSDMSNCTIVRNAAGHSGGGVFVSFGGLIANNVTIALNSAPVYSGMLGSASIRNTIVADN